MLDRLTQIGPHGLVAMIIGLVVALVVHEFAHARAAYALGDTTAADAGRMSLNPVRHVDPIGTILIPGMLLLFGGLIFGWARPVPVDVRNFRFPRRDALLTSLAGPGANVLAAALFGLLARALPTDTRLPGLAAIIVVLNLTIAFFNLVPIPPLDGASILLYLLDRKPAIVWAIERQGFTLFLLLLVTDSVTGGRILGTLVGAPVAVFARLFLGPTNVF